MNNRLIQLDVLRAVAIIMVFGAHFPDSMGHHNKEIFFISRNFLDLWQRCGWAGVDLFFVLSGFLVSGLLFKEQIKRGEVRLVRFLVRRGFKIYPAFYVMLVASVVSQVVCHLIRSRWPLPDIKSYIWEAVFLQNYGGYVWRHTWSLAVEEHFYLILGLGIFLMTKYVRKVENPFVYIPRAYFILAPLVLLTRILTVHFCASRDWHVCGGPTHLRFDSLLFGVLLSYYAHYHKEALAGFVQKYRAPIAVLSLLLISPIFFVYQMSAFVYTVGFTMFYLGFGGLLMIFVHWEIPNDRVRKLLTPLAGIGLYSYSIYLWHWPVVAWWHILQFKIWGNPENAPEIWTGGVYIVASLVVGIGMAKIIEIPFIKLRNRWFPSMIVSEDRKPASVEHVSVG